MAKNKYPSEMDVMVNDLVTNGISVTKAVKRACASFNVEFNDTVRRRFQDVVNKSDTNQYKNEVQLSAMKPDGTIMNIEEYCVYYGILFEQARTYKLITHTGTPYYNIASNILKADDISKFFDDLLKDLSNLPNKPKTIVRQRPVDNETYLLVVDPADCHIGKLSMSFETGEDYNNQIAVKRVKEGVDGIIEKTKGFNIDKVLFVGGNDILHIDTPKRTTTSGTPQDTDGMWYSNFLIAKELYIDVLSRLIEVADVHFVFNPSNHDFTHGFFLANVIETYFKDCKNITFDCDIKHRKYFRYYDNLIGTSHGDGAKTQDLPLLMAQESPDWSSTKHRYVYTHHVHHKTSKDFIGVTVESMRSPSSADGWHSRNGYQYAPKAIEGFLHSKEHGQIARIVHIF